MWRKLSKKQKEQYLNKWIREVVDNKKNTEAVIKNHISRHAKHIFARDPLLWSSSMRNLVETFEAKHNIKPSVKIRLERLENKYKKNPKRYTPPPNLKK